jgi:hypothetical protein
MTNRPTPFTQKSLPCTSTRVVLALALLGTGACASTEMEVPLNHPGHPHARAGRVAQTEALKAAYDLQSIPLIDGPSDVHGHQSHGANAAHEAPSTASPTADQPTGAAVFTCPMHPEIIRKDAGNCPICGMKLVPKKDAK